MFLFLFVHIVIYNILSRIILYLSINGCYYGRSILNPFYLFNYTFKKTTDIVISLILEMIERGLMSLFVVRTGLMWFGVRDEGVRDAKREGLISRGMKNHMRSLRGDGEGKKGKKGKKQTHFRHPAINAK